MNEYDPAVTFSNPRLLAAVYFGLLSVVGTTLTNAFLNSIGIQQVVPIFQAVLVGMIVASCTGAIFGERLIHCLRPYKAKAFWIGFIMVIASLPVFVLGLLLFMQPMQNALFSMTTLQSMIYTYLVTLAYSYVLFGIALAITSGFAAMFLRGHLVYDVLHTNKQGAYRPVTQHAEKRKPIYRRYMHYRR